MGRISIASDEGHDDDDSGRQALFAWRMKRKHGQLWRLSHILNNHAVTSSDSLPMLKENLEVLSVDDDRINHMVIKQILCNTDASQFKVVQATDGAEALEILEERYTLGGIHHFPDIILMDNRMTNMSGLHAIREIRTRYPQSRVPIIMLSANDDEDSIVQGLQAGCNDYVTKPFKHLELVARIALQIKMMNLYNRELEARQHEEILNEILPMSVINRLKSGQQQIADELEEVTILFSDIVGFTELAASSSTPDIIKMLDTLFSRFDDLVDRHEVYKVETIGDAYMIVSGHDSDSASNHADRILRVAMAMINAVSDLKTPQGSQLRIRIGIHTGPAYAGVVGHKCPRYCLFGDTVNTASRMESNGFPMTIHVSNTTHTRIVESPMAEHLDFCDLGLRPIKGKGQMQTWLLKFGHWQQAMQTYERGSELDSPALLFSTPEKTSASLSRAAVEYSAVAAKLDEFGSKLSELAASVTAALTKSNAEPDLREAMPAPESERLPEVLTKLDSLLEQLEPLRNGDLLASSWSANPKALRMANGHVDDASSIAISQELSAMLNNFLHKIMQHSEQLAESQQLSVNGIGLQLQTLMQMLESCNQNVLMQHALQLQISEDMCLLHESWRDPRHRMVGSGFSQRPWMDGMPGMFVAHPPFSTPMSTYSSTRAGRSEDGIHHRRATASSDLQSPAATSWQQPDPRSFDGRQAFTTPQPGAPTGLPAEVTDLKLYQLLSSVGLQHYCRVLQANGVTVEKIRTLQPHELSRYGVMTTGAQFRIVEAAISATDQNRSPFGLGQ